MKKYRVVFRAPYRADAVAKVEEVEADGCRVDSDLVLLYQRRGDAEVRVFDIPKTLFMRIHEI